MKTSALFAILLAAGSAPAYSVTVAIAPGTYTENFNHLVSSSTTPAAGWSLAYGATASSLGSSASSGPVSTWDSSTGQFKDVSSDNIPFGSSAADQNANTDRALAMRQVRSMGDPGMALNFNFSSATVNVNTISIDLLILEEQVRAATLSIQYAVGSSPTSFTTLATWSDPGAFGTTTMSFDRSQFGSALDGQQQVWFRVAALSSTTGSGSVFDMIAIDNFSINSTAVPEASVTLLGVFGALGLLRRRR